MTPDPTAYAAPEMLARLDALEARIEVLEQRLGAAGQATASGAAGASPYGSSDSVQDAVDPWSVAPWPEIVSLLRERKKIVAIKVYRERTGVGLQEAKETVEEVERRIGLA